MSATEQVRLLEGEAIDLLAEFEVSSFDVVVTDPPFGILRDEPWDRSRPPIELWRAILRVLKPGGRLVVVADDRVLPWLATDIVRAGFEFEGLDAWVFADGRPRARNQLRPAFAPIVVARAPGPPVVATLDDAARVPWRDERDRAQTRRANSLHRAKRRIYADDLDRTKTYEPHPAGRWPSNVFATDDLLGHQQHIFQVPRVRDPDGHPAAKPVGLIVQLLRIYAPAGGLVLDPFCGAGTTGIAALACDRRAVLMEREPRFIAMAETNLKAAKSGSFALSASIGLDSTVSAPGGIMSDNEHLLSNQQSTRIEVSASQHRTNPSEHPRLLSAPELAVQLGISVRTLLRLRRSGKISAIRLGPRTVRFDPQAVRAALAAGDLNEDQDPGILPRRKDGRLGDSGVAHRLERPAAPALPAAARHGIGSEQSPQEHRRRA